MKLRASALKTLEVSTVAEWRRWLASHHDSESEIRLVFHKVHTGRPSISYDDSVSEALCFGWVDSLGKRLDDDRFARKFTPRRPDSVWSESNRRRYKALAASGRLTPAGRARAPTAKRPAMPAKREWPLVPYIQQAIRKNSKAWKTFERLPPGERRHYIGWIDSAKQQETKLRRLAEAVRLLAAGKRLGLK